MKRRLRRLLATASRRERAVAPSFESDPLSRMRFWASRAIGEPLVSVRIHPSTVNPDAVDVLLSSVRRRPPAEWASRMMHPAIQWPKWRPEKVTLHVMIHRNVFALGIYRPALSDIRDLAHELSASCHPS